MIIFLYLKFPEEIPNEQSAMPKRETLVGAVGGTLAGLSPYSPRSPCFFDRSIKQFRMRAKANRSKFEI